MKFLVLGCNGMAGHMITIYLKEQGHEVVGFARSKSPFTRTIIGDARNLSDLQSVVAEDYDALINCIGLLNDNAERNKADAVFLNSYLPHFLAKITYSTHTQVIHISTDCVFSGKRGRYSENDCKDGPTFYDRTKALGELCDEKNLTLRQSIVGPDLSPNGIGLFNWFMQQKQSVKGFSRVMWTGQTTLQLAKTIEAAAMQRINGLYNMVPDTSISKYELLCLFNEIMRSEKISIIPDPNKIIDKSLERTNWVFDYRIPQYEQMVSELYEWLKEHRELYSHYGLR